ncbi:uncharacterized protein LOC118164672 isoform X1 [Oxyura jamaicensis]|uniref:uncharacterized protein LOC118164672 isoform X1 n=1 Tax=Oxyura jamaicensis TaxID=8884 RepID=UPI0015A538F0|nr:uncharacterized protein LOC118164672 isoform X1 [Oxyura jamaicensis]
MLTAAVRGPRADLTARNVPFSGRNNTTANKLFRRHLQPHQHGSAVVRSHLSDSPPAAPLRLRGSARSRKPPPRLPAPQSDSPEPPGPAEWPGQRLERPGGSGRSPLGEGAGAEGGQRLSRGQSPTRRGACAHPPAACGVFRGIRFQRIWERRWRGRKAPVRQSPSPPSRMSTRPLSALLRADSCGIQTVLVWKRSRPTLRASRSAAAEDGAQLGL